VVGQRRVVVETLRPRRQGLTGVVLFAATAGRAGRVVPARRVGRAERRVRPPHEDALQGGEHGVEHGGGQWVSGFACYLPLFTSH
jgi:hypothetical protein